MNPFYFGDSSSPLYGVYHPAAPGARRRGARVLLCYPLGHEYMRVHRAYVQLARRLAAAGCPVLRFDYGCCGDSAGETGRATLSSWQGDIALAARELEDTAGPGRLLCVGLRLGAALLSKAVANGLGAAGLVLWDPVVSGPDYLRALRALQAERTRLFSQVSAGGGESLGEGAEELVGYPYPDAVLNELGGINLSQAAWGKVRKVFLLLSEVTPANQALREALAGRDLLAGYDVVPSAGDWYRVDGRARISAEALDVIARWATEDGR